MVARVSTRTTNERKFQVRARDYSSFIGRGKSFRRL